jgi:hypothetical protein
MSFQISGAGPRASVIGQVRSHRQWDEQELAVRVRDFIVAVLRSQEPELPHNGGVYVYSVQASGHHGHGSPLQLSLTINPMWVPAVQDNEEEQPAGSGEMAGQVSIDDAIGEHASAAYDS